MTYRIIFSLLIASLGSSLISACTHSDISSSKIRQPAVFYGVPAKINGELHRRVFEISSFVENPETGAIQFATCSSTAIGKRTILTARHCVDKKIVSMTITFPNGKDSRTMYSVSEKNFIPHPNIISTDDNRVNRAKDDIALIRLDKDIPDYALVTEIDRNYQVRNGSNLLFAGYGLTEIHPTIASGLKPDGPVIPELRVGTLNVTGAIPHLFLIYTEDRETPMPCSGDSGGPVFNYQNKKFTQVGVTCQSLCELTAIYSSLREKIAWLDANTI